MIETITIRQLTKQTTVVRILTYKVTYKVKWEFRLCWAWVGLVLLETERRRFTTGFIFRTGNLVKSRQDPYNTCWTFISLSLFEINQSNFLLLKCLVVFWILWGYEIFYFNNLIYPENSSSESGSASEACFLEVFSGCLCMVEVRAGFCRPLPMQLLSNQELDAEPGAYTRQTSVLSPAIPSLATKRRHFFVTIQSRQYLFQLEQWSSCV